MTRECSRCGGRTFTITTSRAVKCEACGQMVAVVEDTPKLQKEGDECTEAGEDRPGM